MGKRAVEVEEKVVGQYRGLERKRGIWGGCNVGKQVTCRTDIDEHDMGKV